MSKQISREDLDSIATVYDGIPGMGAVGFEKLLPTAATARRNSLNRTVSSRIDDDEPAIKTSAKPGEDFSNKTTKKEDDSYLLTAAILSSIASNEEPDENDEISSLSAINFIKGLEAVGMPVAGIKRAFETITGTSYADFETSAYAGGRISIGSIAGYGRAAGPLVGNAGFNNGLALSVASRDNAGSGFCGRGTYNVCRAMGWDVQRANGGDWDENLSRNRNWVRLNVNPANAPVGSVLVYDSDIERGRAARNKGGGKSGHVEVVGEENGRKVFISDKARNNWGGSVPDNYAAAFMYVGPGAPASNMQLAQQYGTSRSRGGPSLDLT